MKLERLMALIQTALILLLTYHNWPIIEAKEDVEPPFPLLFSQSQIKQHRFHIVTESISEATGYETHEEYLDVEGGKSTFIVSDKNGRSVTHIDSELDIVFRYKPYICSAMKPAEVEHAGNDGLWHREVRLDSEPGEAENVLLVYGVAALWLNAGDLPKTYSDSSIIYSASKDIHKTAHKWTITDEFSESLVHLFFIENKSQAKDSKLSLEMIQIESIKAQKIVRTVNILLIEYSIDEEVYDNVMQVPVGYGCLDPKLASDRSQEGKSYLPVFDIYLGPLLERSHKLDIEVTATKFDETTQKRSSDTISVELAYDKEQYLSLMRQRDTKRDIKTITNYIYRVEYTIDLRRGTCRMTNGKVTDQIVSDFAMLNFENGLKFELDHRVMMNLFIRNGEFFFVKKTKAKQNQRSSDYLYYEAQATTFSRPARIIRVYSSAAMQKMAKLESVTVLFFNPNDESRISESYHFNLIEVRSIDGSLDICRTFDISEECYLNNEKMKQGRDYTWFELTYPFQSISTRHSEIIAAHSMEFKQMVHDRFVEAGLSLFNSPRIELIFDTSLIIRALLLDMPSLTLLYESHKDTVLKSDKSTGDLTDLTVDLEHCADLCRLNKCSTMSFCESQHTCLLSVGLPDGTKRSLERNSNCESFTRPEMFNFESEATNQRLHHIISELQHRNYDPIPLPKMPDELVYPRSQTGIDDATSREITDAYLAEVLQFMKENGQDLPELTLNLSIDDNLIILMPSQFEVELDPLSEFSLTSDDSSSDSDYQEQSAPTFHEGLNLYSYKMDLINRDEQKNWRLFNGLNYDQCALACVDSKCSSFSYCTHRQECIITDVYTIGESVNQNTIKPDLDCFIAQRDFLSKFNKFRDVFRPNVYKRTSNALNPSECAHSCMVESDFNCLAFDYCQPNQADGHEGQLSTCFYLDERRIYTGAESEKYEAITTNTNSTDKTKKQQGNNKLETGCDHYSRSYLADFLRIEYREIVDAELSKLKTSSFEGRSVDQCAELCVDTLFDCSAFQFCFDPWAEGAKQNCIMIESKPQVSDSADTQVVLDQTKDGQIIKAGKLFARSENCNVFFTKKR
ncbi:hypothetical protein SUGI_1488570 [Cryptomeria japonica]|uniref:Uncharacterized protein n=1 Tax=Cryptomeria japonica TaxID=3369 RepID=A0AAD3RRJ9_CRYJA|nr:hypothetical protein SUGI_1488570 [Cryptomeria japonica]